jgi:hypothetical protein
VNGAATDRVVVEEQHGLLCCLGIGEGDETIALQHTQIRTASKNSKKGLGF